MKKKFNPSFKEKDKDQFYFKDGVWIKTDELWIVELWAKWVVSKNPHRYFDKDGSLIFGNYEK